MSSTDSSVDREALDAARAEQLRAFQRYETHRITARKYVSLFAIGSRIVTVLIIALISSGIQPYDESVNLSFDVPKPLESFLNWDAYHFIGIARDGYRSEHTHAFFPLWPALIRLGAYLLKPLQLVGASFDTILVLSAIFIATFLFCFAATALYDICWILIGSPRIAMWAGFFFCFNPASVFFSVPYSTSLFAYISFMVWRISIASFLTGRTCFMGPRLLCFLVAAGFARANGIFLAGIPLYYSLLDILLSFKIESMLKWYHRLWNIFVLFLTVAPFYLVQKYAAYKTGFNEPFWMFYNTIQGKFWNVGLFKYFTAEQLPNILLALPMLILVFYQGTKLFFARCWPFIQMLAFGSVEKQNRNIQIPHHVFPEVGQIVGFPLIPMFIHLFVSSALVFITANTQIITRVIWSANPLPALIMAVYSNKIHAIWICLYYAAGVCLFSAFLPWT